jgi:transcriptional regulator with XRE-family HTH domain
MSSTLAAPLDIDEVIADIGDRVRAERQARGWSARELGERCGLTKDQVQRVETGFIGMRNFALACRALDRPMADLLSDRWRMPERGPVLTARQVQVLRAVAGGDPLSVAAERLGMPRDGLASRLSEIYRRLGVAEVPRLQRRAAAVRVASEHGLFNAA